MDILTGAFTVIGTLVGVVGVLWVRDQSRERKSELQRSNRDKQINTLTEDMRKSEAKCHSELSDERRARESFQSDTIEWMKQRSERDQQVFVNLQHALERLGSSVSEQRRDIRRLSGEHQGEDPQRATTVSISAITGIRK